MYKQSKFNYVCLNKNKELLLFNTLVGPRSLCKIVDGIKQKQFFDGKFEEDTFTKNLLEKGIIVSKEIDENLKLFENTYATLNPNYLSITINPTERCNFRCKYCYETYNKPEISKEVKKDIVKYVNKNIHKYSELQVSWFGGEPLLAIESVKELSVSFMQICKFFKRKYSASMTTNAYLLNVDSFIELLNCGIKGFQITIDGTEKTHNYHRPLSNGAPTYKTIVNNLSEIKKLQRKDFHIVLRSNITNETFDNLNEYLKSLSDICSNDSRFSVSICFVSEWSNNLEENFTKTFIHNRDKILELYKKIIDEDIKINLSVALHPEAGSCHLAKRSSFLVRPNGEIHKCSINFENPQFIVGMLKTEKLNTMMLCMKN